ncbi:MlaC/ttg2D family ABC transporter substrate-binding protein [Thiocapsa marina]|uniref:Toluene tolerance family protein n=1 Tax=Thiocapsa marina 5811 TaxID=768671 RepID=F9U8Y3_9GAMM|nr:ABC transporter substrate-binding protein [Thiocapsa marina]EGV19241.1 toluene tolerance family protein [Thiocapsa marina 5811]
MPYRRSFFVLFALLGVLWTSASFAYADDATALVKRTTENMLKTLEARRSEVDRDPSLIFGMIESGVAPHFDFERITQGAVGQSWRNATPAQQRALVNGFKQVLIRTYARSILSYSGEEIRYLPVKPGRQPSTVTVATEILSPGSAPIPVDYRMHNNSGGWKVYDVVINNASLVGNYRTSFSNEIRQGGIDGLIAKLGEMNTRTGE